MKPPRMRKTDPIHAKNSSDDCSSTRRSKRRPGSWIRRSGCGGRFTAGADARTRRTAESSDEALLDNIGLFDLVDALQGILNRNPGKKLLEIIPDNLTVRDRMNAILETLEGQESIDFEALFEASCHRLGDHRDVLGVAGTHSTANGAGLSGGKFWADSGVARLLVRAGPGGIG